MSYIPSHAQRELVCRQFEAAHVLDREPIGYHAGCDYRLTYAAFHGKRHHDFLAALLRGQYLRFVLSGRSLFDYAEHNAQLIRASLRYGTAGTDEAVPSNLEALRYSFRTTGPLRVPFWSLALGVASRHRCENLQRLADRLDYESAHCGTSTQPIAGWAGHLGHEDFAAHHQLQALSLLLSPLHGGSETQILSRHMFLDLLRQHYIDPVAPWSGLTFNYLFGCWFPPCYPQSVRLRLVADRARRLAGLLDGSKLQLHPWFALEPYLLEPYLPHD